MGCGRIQSNRLPLLAPVPIAAQGVDIKNPGELFLKGCVFVIPVMTGVVAGARDFFDGCSSREIIINSSIITIAFSVLSGSYCAIRFIKNHERQWACGICTYVMCGLIGGTLLIKNTLYC